MSVRTRFIAVVAALGLALLAAGCGGGDDKSSDSAREGAKSLSEAMDRAAQLMDDVGATSGSLDRYSQDITGPISQTGDVIALLTGSDETESKLRTAARQQRTFLQATDEAASARTKSGASRALLRARSAGRRASSSYARVVAEDDSLAGLVPDATTFNTSNLRRAVTGVHAKKKVKKKVRKRRSSSSSGSSSSGGSSGSSGGSGGTNCGGGVIAMNSVTSCPFARNVATTFRNAGGDSVIDVYSPVTDRVYTMRCNLQEPVICRGGNGAAVRIR